MSSADFPRPRHYLTIHATGLLLDMDDLLPTTSATSLSPPATPSSPPSYTPTAAFKPLPTNPHSLVGADSPTFPLAVSMYRALLVSLASDHSRRKEMGRAAAREAATKSWHGAMEILVEGYKEIARPLEQEEKDGLSLSRTSTIEVDIVCDSAERDLASASTEVEGTATGSRRRKLLRLGGVFRRTGGRLRESSGSMSMPLRSWLGGAATHSESGMERVGVAVGQKSLQSSGPVWATRESRQCSSLRRGSLLT